MITMRMKTIMIKMMMMITMITTITGPAKTGNMIINLGMRMMMMMITIITMRMKMMMIRMMKTMVKKSSRPKQVR